MTIEDIGLEPVFEAISEEEPVKKKKTLKKVSKELVETVEEPTSAPVEKKKKKKKAKGPKAVEPESAPSETLKRPLNQEDKKEDGEPPKKLNRKQTKILKREMFQKLEAEGKLLPQAPKVQKKKPEKKEKGKKEPKKKEPKPYVDYRALDQKYCDILCNMENIEGEREARTFVEAECKEKEIPKEEVSIILERWRWQRQRAKKNERIREIIDFDGSLEEVKKMVNELVKKRKLRHEDAGDIVTKWKLREKRRLSRQDEKAQNRTCYHCRLPGHVLSDCPTKDEEAVTNTEGICFKCGSMEHNIYTCPKKNIRGFPFATCFICNQEGHLSRDCESNKTGIYPDGGCCNVCGSQKHLKRDCPELAKQKKGGETKSIIGKTMNAMSSADDDYDPSVSSTSEVVTTKSTKKKKVVKF